MSASASSVNKGGVNRLFLILAGIFLIAAAVLVFLVNRQNDQQRMQLAAINKLQVLSQQIAKFSTEAAGGNLDAFDQLSDTRDQIVQQVNWLSGGRESDATRLNPSEQPAMDALPTSVSLDQVAASWTEIAEGADDIAAAQDDVLDLAEIAGEFAVSVPLLQARLDEVVQVMADINAAPTQIYRASSQLAVADRMLRRVDDILQGGGEAQSAADAFGRDAVGLRQVLEGMRDGGNGMQALRNPEARSLLGDVLTVFEQVDGNVTEILDSSGDLLDVRTASDDIFVFSEEMLQNATDLQNQYNDGVVNRSTWSASPIGIGWPAASALAGLLFLAFYALSDRQATVRASAATESVNQRNQEAILRLLDEMGSLAEGDLTVKATVTEDITGAIADSVNFAIEALRSLVTTINETAVQVASAAQETQATAMHLAEASEHQAQQITSASAAINEIAVSIDEVSKNSAESADVATRSVSIATKGADVVRQTIDGMDNIRDQIQETSKRIKRLGESSQEIGDIVELINDIAEQTNILALNAAIQAASAGEAGRGFAVVADEVQRLAERASNATKRIETLVQTIQADTNEAVISMEQTTAEVVNGARLAEDAGEALGEIEKVSTDLADLIQNISEAARQQSAAATNISGTMNVIQEITTQTSAGTSQTAESIGHLADLAAELRRSVADFKLPA